MFKKNIIILLADVVAILYLPLRKIMEFFKNKRVKKSLRILVYHSVSGELFYKDTAENNISSTSFRRHMNILKESNKKIISLDEGITGLKNNDLPHDSIAVTFDDGLANVYREAVNILEELNIPATFFITYKHADGEKDTFKPGDLTAEEFMDWDMLTSLRKRGFELGSHSYSHNRLSTLTDDELETEIAGSKKRFEEMGIPVKYFAYPYGFYSDFSKKTQDLIKKAGYSACFTNIMGGNHPGDNLFELRRTRTSWRDNALRFKMKIDGAYDWIDTLKLLFRNNRY